MDAANIAQMYRDCMQRNSNLLLNLSPDKRGLLPDEAVNTLTEVTQRIRK